MAQPVSVDLFKQILEKNRAEAKRLNEEKKRRAEAEAEAANAHLPTRQLTETEKQTLIMRGIRPNDPSLQQPTTDLAIEQRCEDLRKSSLEFKDKYGAWPAYGACSARGLGRAPSQVSKPLDGPLHLSFARALGRPAALAGLAQNAASPAFGMRSGDLKMVLDELDILYDENTLTSEQARRLLRRKSKGVSAKALCILRYQFKLPLEELVGLTYDEGNAMVEELERATGADAAGMGGNGGSGAAQGRNSGSGEARDSWLPTARTRLQLSAGCCTLPRHARSLVHALSLQSHATLALSCTRCPCRLRQRRRGWRKGWRHSAQRRRNSWCE
jgi:hypothetical protein